MADGMIINRRYGVTDANMTSNVLETPPAAYNAGTTYALGAQVSVFGGPSNTTATMYESLQAGNTGHTPSSSPTWWVSIGTAYLAYNAGTGYATGAIVTSAHRLYESISAGTNAGHALTDPAWWLEIGPSNQWAMFDDMTGSQTIRPNSIQVEIDATGIIDTIGMLNVSAASINVQMIVDAVVVFDEDFSMTAYDNINDYYEYFFEPDERIDYLVVTGLPNNFSPTIKVTATDTGDVAIGHFEIGHAFYVGRVTYGAEFGITDYSKFETNDFGETYIVPRGYRDWGRFNVVIPKERVGAVKQLLSKYHATPALVVAVENYPTSYYGLIKDWRVEIAYPHESLLSLEVQGF
jgi:hypothetical protein